MKFKYNILRNIYYRLKEEDANSAKTGAVETTKEPKGYPFCENSKITLWDLPGLGAPDIPNVDTYYSKAKLAEYDVFVIMCAARFTNGDKELAKKLKSMDKTFFFVRSKIDLDILNEKTKLAFREKKLLEEMRQDCCMGVKEVMKEMINKKDIYLISNKHKNRWDFSQLQISIAHNLPLKKTRVLQLFDLGYVSRYCGKKSE